MALADALGISVSLSMVAVSSLTVHLTVATIPGGDCLLTTKLVDQVVEVPTVNAWPERDQRSAVVGDN